VGPCSIRTTWRATINMPVRGTASGASTWKVTVPFRLPWRSSAKVIQGASVAAAVALALVFSEIAISSQHRSTVRRANPAAFHSVREQVSRAANDSSRHKIVLTIPVTASALKATVGRLSAATRTPISLEVAPDREDLIGRAQSRDTAQSSGHCDLTDMALPEALDKIMRCAPAYTWAIDGGMIHFRPARFVDEKRAALDRRVQQFHFDASDVQEALLAVHRVFDPDYRGPTRRRQRPAHVRPFFEKPLRISLQAVSVRAILDEMVRQHGAMSWHAEYVNASGAYAGMKLSFVGFDNWSTVMGAQAPPER
jgi:hypothetical protein